MKKKIYFIGLLVALTIMLSCEKTVEIPEFTCNLQTISNINTLDQIEVTYKLEATGDYTVNSWYYFGENGKVEISQPSLPSEIVLTLSSQKLLRAGAIGEIVDGSISVSYNAVAADTTFFGIDKCVQFLNK
jgi:hypothetical protein